MEFPEINFFLLLCFFSHLQSASLFEFCAHTKAVENSTRCINIARHHSWCHTVCAELSVAFITLQIHAEFSHKGKEGILRHLSILLITQAVTDYYYIIIICTLNRDQHSINTVTKNSLSVKTCLLRECQLWKKETDSPFLGNK